MRRCLRCRRRSIRRLVHKEKHCSDERRMTPQQNRWQELQTQDKKLLCFDKKSATLKVCIVGVEPL